MVRTQINQCIYTTASHREYRKDYYVGQMNSIYARSGHNTMPVRKSAHVRILRPALAALADYGLTFTADMRSLLGNSNNVAHTEYDYGNLHDFIPYAVIVKQRDLPIRCMGAKLWRTPAPVLGGHPISLSKTIMFNLHFHHIP